MLLLLLLLLLWPDVLEDRKSPTSCSSALSASSQSQRWAASAPSPLDAAADTASVIGIDRDPPPSCPLRSKRWSSGFEREREEEELLPESLDFPSLCESLPLPLLALPLVLPAVLSCFCCCCFC